MNCKECGQPITRNDYCRICAQEFERSAYESLEKAYHHGRYTYTEYEVRHKSLDQIDWTKIE